MTKLVILCVAGVVFFGALAALAQPIERHDAHVSVLTRHVTHEWRALIVIVYHINGKCYAAFQDSSGLAVEPVPCPWDQR